MPLLGTKNVTQDYVSLCPKYTGVRPDIWLGLVSLGSEGLSRPRCGIYCKIINITNYRAQPLLLNHTYLNNSISTLEYNTTIHQNISDINIIHIT